jgi:hypothetical protein
MGDVIPMPQRAVGKSDTAEALDRMSAQENAGELQGSILIATTAKGTEFHVLGACAERLQLAVLTMVKGLGIVTDKIVATGTAGNTRSDSVNATWGAAPKRRMPRRLIEATKLGELE